VLLSTGVLVNTYFFLPFGDLKILLQCASPVIIGNRKDWAAR
jgi:hypothetical protein